MFSVECLGLRVWGSLFCLQGLGFGTGYGVETSHSRGNLFIQSASLLKSISKEMDFQVKIEIMPSPRSAAEGEADGEDSCQDID